MPRISSRVLTAVVVTLATAGVIGAAGLNWGGHTMSIPGTLGGGIGEFETTGWAGRLIVGPFWLPNWMVVFASGIVCWCSWLRAVRVGRIPAALPIAFTLYGVAHAGAMVFLFWGGSRASLGPGAPLTVLAFAAMLVMIVQDVLIEARHTRSG
ncbi:hypothetical protein AB1L88_06545 [Tautonia sp. JC769]|uniref:hypothetical protein n=1 Tax=Tautonia sp. JC769 TaxID=3232135 RepID=UPI0034586899